MAKEGDIVKITTKDEEFQGILMPRPDLLDKNITVIYGKNEAGKCNIIWEISDEQNIVFSRSPGITHSAHIFGFGFCAVHGTPYSAAQANPAFEAANGQRQTTDAGVEG